MKIAECTSCGSKFDVTPYKPGSKLRCAKCKGVFVVPDMSGVHSTAGLPSAAGSRAGSGPVPSPAAKKNAEDSFFPEDSESPQHDWKVPPKDETEEPGPSSKPKVTKQPTRALKLPAKDPASSSGPSASRRMAKPGAEAMAGGRAGAGRGGGRKAPAKAPNTMLIMLGSVGVMVIAVGLLIFAFTDNKKKAGGGNGGSGTGDGGGGEKPPAEDFASKKAKTNMGSISEVLALVNWCDQKGLTKERDELFEVAYKLDPKAMAEKCRAIAKLREPHF